MLFFFFNIIKSAWRCVGNWAWNAVWGEGVPVFWERKTHSPAHNCTVILQHKQGWGQQANTWTRVTLGGSQPKGGTSSQPRQGSDHSPIPTTAPWGEEGRGKVGLEKGWKGVLIFDLVSHHLIPLNLPVNYIIFPPVKSALPMTATAQWTHCLYLNLWAFSSYFLSLSNCII